MRRRLAAVLLTLALWGCDQVPAPKSPATPPPKSAPVTPPRYSSVPSPTLAAVRKRGWLVCGVNSGLPGFAFPDVRGEWRGFDVDICRAVAAAVLGDASKVRFVVVTVQDRFSALRESKIDLLSRNTTWTFSRDAGLDFPAVVYFDGQGFMAPKAMHLTSAEELAGGGVCVLGGASGEGNLKDWLDARGLKARLVIADSAADARRLYQEDECDAYTADISALASARSVLNNPNAHVILSDVISKEPMSPVTRQDDPAWTDIVRWTVYAVILGEELGLNSRSVERARAEADDPQIRRLLGAEGDLGTLMDLPPDWAYQAIRQVGTYEEIFRRNVGRDSPLKLDRGLNALWNADKPGLLYAPPMR